jgi:cytochrome P450
VDIKMPPAQNPIVLSSGVSQISLTTSIADRIRAAYASMPSGPERSVRVAPAEHEHLQAAAHRVLHETAARPQVQEVVAADRRRDDQHRLPPHRPGGRRVLDDLGQLVAVHDGARRDGQIRPDRERATVRLRRHAPIRPNIPPPLPRAPGHARAPGIERPLERRRIAPEHVGGRGRAHHDVGHEPGPLGVLPAPLAEIEIVDQVPDRFAQAQVLLAYPPERGVLRPRRVGEAPVALGRGPVGPAGQDAQRVPGQPARLPHHAPRLGQRHGHAQQQQGRPARRPPVAQSMSDDDRLLDPAVQDNPFPYYRQLRAEQPVLRMPGTGFYVLTRYEDLRAVLRDPDTFSNTLDLEELSGEKARQLTGSARWSPTCSASATSSSIPSRAAEQPSSSASSRPLPGIVFSEQLGLAASEIGTFRRWADAMLAPAQGLLTDEGATIAYADIEAEAQHYLADVFAARRAKPTGDLISALVAASEQEERPLTMPELQNLLQQLITGGYIITADAITAAMWLLIENPEQARRLRADPGLIKTFAEEALRMLAPVQGLFRKATRDVELHGVTIPKDAILHVRYGAANRDGETFPQPDDFDVTREHVMRHMSFGQGPHACVGAPLARQELVTAFERLLARLDDLHLDGEPERHHGLLFYSFKTLPIRFRPASPP